MTIDLFLRVLSVRLAKYTGVELPADLEGVGPAELATQVLRYYMSFITWVDDLPYDPYPTTLWYLNNKYEEPMRWRVGLKSDGTYLTRQAIAVAMAYDTEELNQEYLDVIETTLVFDFTMSGINFHWAQGGLPCIKKGLAALSEEEVADLLN